MQPACNREVLVYRAASRFPVACRTLPARIGHRGLQMWRALRDFLVIVLAVALGASTPVLSHAQTAVFPASHELRAVGHYADLSVDPSDEGCPHAVPSGPQDQNNDLCKKC